MTNENPQQSRLFMTVCLMAVIALLGSGSAVNAAENEHPFSPGEKLIFQIKWMNIPAGEAVLEVLPIETVNGAPSRHFRLTAKSNSFVDIFYKVRDVIDAYADTEMTRSVLYKKKQQEGKTRRDVVVTFDWENNKTRYADFDAKRDPVDLLPGSFDPLSAFYFVRTLDLLEKSTVERPITDGKKCIIGKIAVMKREPLALEKGTYDTFLIEPELKHIGGVFEKSRNAKIQIWITADRRRIPLRIKSKVVIGSVVGELVSGPDLH